MRKLGLAGPLLIAPGRPKQLQEWLKLNPSVAGKLAFVDDTSDYEAFRAAGFGLLTEGGMPKDMQLRAPDFGGNIGAMFNYMKSVAFLSPVRDLNEGFPKGVLLLGGTLLLQRSRVVFARADRVPGDYPAPDVVLSVVERKS